MNWRRKKLLQEEKMFTWGTSKYLEKWVLVDDLMFKTYVDHCIYKIC